MLKTKSNVMSPIPLVVGGVLLATAVNFWLFTNKMVFWDYWIIYHYVADGRWDDFIQMFKDIGYVYPFTPALSQFLVSIDLFPHGIRYITFFVLIVNALLFVYILHDTNMVRTRNYLLLVGAFLVLSPINTAGMSMMSAPYFMWMFLYLVGFIAYMKSVSNTNSFGISAIALRIVSLLVMAWSFNIESMLALHFGFLLFLVEDSVFIERIRPRRIVKKILPFSDALILPFVYYSSRMILFQPSGMYENYNTIKLSFGSVHAFIQYVRFFVYEPFELLLGIVSEHAVVAIFIALVVSLLYLGARYLYSRKASDEKEEVLATGKFLLLGVLFIVFAVIPYLAVSVSPSLDRWSVRHAIPLVYGQSLLFLALYSALKKSTRINDLVAESAVLLILIGSSVASTGLYMRHQQRAVVDEAIIHNLQELQPPRDISTYYIDNTLEVGLDESYRFYEWAGIFKEAWGEERWIGIVVPNYYERFHKPNSTLREIIEGPYKHRYLLTDYDITGKDMYLHILPEHDMEYYHSTEMIFSYWASKRAGEEEAGNFLLELLELRFSEDGEAASGDAAS